MARIESSAEIAAPPERVWEVVADLDSEPKYWKGTRSVRNISREGNELTREVVIAFRDQKCLQRVVLDPPRSIRADFVEGVIKGSKEVLLEPSGGGTTVRVIWEIRMTGILGMFTGAVAGHIRKGTGQALESIRKEIEQDV
ncbi:MAG: SRPBCC family protein [Nitrosopumilus sp.]|nr:SRPBCC family protein [Nitrosopumilus sp.]CAI9831247.1 Cyclase/dehydrase [Nitrosopumilaceae archaeon]MDA7940725.1 SRPBCC family protein [Nitrosopumilus sp.]MDA7942933.1 SRPBCC family protein [Nitrosopumilus sp.]MDA7944656.1 SRPBCC family protein [Nitrosopumilus sp.]